MRWVVRQFLGILGRLLAGIVLVLILLRHYGYLGGEPPLSEEPPPEQTLEAPGEAEPDGEAPQRPAGE